MSRDDKLQELLDLAALLQAGALDREESARVEWLVDGAGDEVRAASDAFKETAGELGFAVQPVEPPDELRRRLLDSIEKEASPQQPGIVLDDQGLLIARSGEIPWRPHELPGLAYKRLSLDRDSGMATTLLRLDPGAVYPSHRHEAAEHLLVLSGDLEVHGQRMGPGDYCRAEPGSVHEVGRSIAGGVVLVHASIHDKLLSQ